MYEEPDGAESINCKAALKFDLRSLLTGRRVWEKFTELRALTEEWLADVASDHFSRGESLKGNR